MTINPETVKAYARELLEAEERGYQRGYQAGYVAALKVWLERLDARIAKLKAERQGEAMEVAGNRESGG